MNHPCAYLRCLLTGVALLAFFSITKMAVADLVVDGGATYTVTADISNDNVTVGQNSTGTLIQGGFTNTVNSDLLLGENSGSNGTYNLSGGNLSVNQDAKIGNAGTGTFTQSGGTHTASGNLTLGNSPGSPGTYNLQGGSLSVGNNVSAGDAYIGYSGTGIFTQSNGTHTVTNNLSLGDQSGGTGTYNLSGGELKTFYSTIGSSGTGIFNQSGGTHEINDNRTLSLGFNPGSSGTYNLSGGTLSSGDSIIGYAGSGAFTQTGGGHGCTNFVMGGNAGSIGTYNLSNGELDVGNNVTIGSSGRGTFTQRGGAHNVFVDLILGNNASGTGTYNLDGGSLALISKFSPSNAYIGNSGTGIFTQTGGTATVMGGNLFLAYNPGSSGTYNLQGGSLTAGTITVNPGGFFNQTGGTLNAAITLAGGTVVAGTDNGLGSQTLTINSGTLQAAPGMTPTLGNPISVGGDFSLGGANNLTLNGAVGLGGATRTLTVTNSGDTTLLGLISNGGLSINNTGGGALNLSGNNAYNGGTTLTAGTLLIGNNAGLGSGGLTINGGTFGASAAGINAANNITVGGSFILGTTAGHSLILSSNLALGGNNLTHTGAGADTLSGDVSGTGTINVNAGTLNLSGANTYNGGTILTAGALLAGNNAAFGTGGLTINGGTIGASAANISVNNSLAIGGNFNMGGAAATNLELTQNMTLAGNLLTHNGASNDTLSGNLTSTAGGGITVTAGTLDLTGSNGGYAGTSTVTGGILNLQGAGNYTGNNTGDGGTLNMNSASAITYSGINTVTGGTINMSSAGSTYSGASTVTGGTLNLSAGTLSGLLTLTGGKFNLSGTGAYTNPAPLTNTAGVTLTVAPGSTLTLGGGLTNSGNTSVNGTLTGALTNNAGGFVNGTGTITGNLISNGTVNPGNSPGTLTVGTYTVNPGGTHVVEIASASNYDRLITTAAGGVTLNGGTLSPRLLGGYLPSTNQVFSNILLATGGGTVAGAFASIDHTRVGSSRTLFWQALYSPTSADLKAVGNYTPADLALSRNQRSVGNTLNSLAPSTTGGDLLTVLDAVNALTNDSSVAATYHDISPAKYAALPTLTMPITHLQFQYLQNRLARERWEAEVGSEAVSAGGGGFMRGFSFDYDNNTKMLLAASNLTVSDAGTRMIQQGVEQRWGIYLEPTANWGSLNATINVVGYRYKNFGFTLGADYWVMDNLLVGVNTGYSKTLTGVGGTGGDLNANVIPFNAYGAYFLQGFYANAALGYTYSGYDMERNIAFGTINRTAKGSTSGNQFQLGAETGYDAKIGNAVVGPVLSLQYATQTVGGFTESNAGALNLKVGSQSADSVQSGVGARASYKAKVGNIAVQPQLSVTWQHEFSDNTRGLNASLASGGSTMNFRTDKIGQDFALISFDVPAKITKNLMANIGYTAEVGRDRSTNQGVNLGLKLKF